MPARRMDGMLMLVLLCAALIFSLPVLCHTPAESSTQDSLGSKAEPKLGLDAEDAERLRTALGYAHEETTHGVGYGHHLHPFYYNNKEDSLFYQCALQGEWRPIVQHKPDLAIDAVLAPPPLVLHHGIPALSHPAPLVIRHSIPASAKLPTQTIRHSIHAAKQQTPLVIRHSSPASQHPKSRRRPFIRPPPLFLRPLPILRRPGPEFPPLGDEHGNSLSPPKLLVSSYDNTAYKDSYGDLIVNKFKNVVPVPVPVQFPAPTFKLPAPLYNGDLQFKDTIYKEAFAILNLKDAGTSQNFADSNLNGVFTDGTVPNDVSGEDGAGKEDEPVVTSQDVQGPLSCTASSHYQVQEHSEEDNALHAEDTTFLSPPPAEPRGRSRFLWGQLLQVPRQRRLFFPFH